MLSKVDVVSLARACMQCTVCGTPKQFPPALGIFPPEAKVLLVGQNPGWAKDDDAERQWWSRSFAATPPADPTEFARWYSRDFGSSYAAKALALVLGEGWLESGRYAFTNAVRCRTEGNATPEEAMITSCSIYTRQLLQRFTGLLVMGRTALDQLNALLGSLIEPLTLTEAKNWVVYAIPHYSAWRKYKPEDLAAGVAAFNDKVDSRGGAK